MPRRTPLSLVHSRAVEHAHAIVLSDDESDAVIELGLRPTYGLHYAPDLGVQAMLQNATAWMQAAEITSAGSAGLIPVALRCEIAALLDEAIPEAALDLESTTSDRDKWRAGYPGAAFPELGAQETEARYKDLIERDSQALHALQSVAAKLELGDD